MSYRPKESINVLKLDKKKEIWIKKKEKKLFCLKLITSVLAVSQGQGYLNLGFGAHNEIKTRLYKKKK